MERIQNEDGKFVQVFNTLYLHANSLPVSECYRLTEKMARKTDPAAAVPSLNQMQAHVKRLPADALRVRVLEFNARSTVRHSHKSLSAASAKHGIRKPAMRPA